MNRTTLLTLIGLAGCTAGEPAPEGDNGDTTSYSAGPVERETAEQRAIDVAYSRGPMHTLEATAQVRLAEEKPDATQADLYGDGAQALYVGSSAEYQNGLLVAFDLPDIQDGWEVKGAKIVGEGFGPTRRSSYKQEPCGNDLGAFMQEYNPDDHGGIAVLAYTAEDAWEQETATWDSVGGASGPIGTYAGKSELPLMVGCDGTGTLEVDVTQGVQAMYAGTVENHGFFVKADPLSGQTGAFQRDSATTGALTLDLYVGPTVETMLQRD